MISSKDLKDKNFTVVANGYAKEEVDYILSEAAGTIDAFTTESDNLYHKLEVLAAKVEEYREDEDSIKATLITAQKMADKIKKESSEASALLLSTSEQTAKETLDSANEEADKIITTAREFSSNLIAEKTEEANNIVSDAQAKANEAINSAKIIAQNILDQAKEISEDLIAKSKAEKEAYDILIATVKNDAKSFVDKLVELYSDQLDSLKGANFDIASDEAVADEEQIDSLEGDIDSLISEISEMAEAIPSEIIVDTKETEDIEPARQPTVDESELVISIPEVEEEPANEEVEEITEDAPIEEFTLAENESEEIEEVEEIEEEEIVEETPADPMEAVAAFSKTTLTPVEPSDEPYIPVIEDEPEEEEKSLFDEEDALPFESYFSVKTEDAHSDKSQTISLIPPEDDEEEDLGFRGFFKKKK